MQLLFVSVPSLARCVLGLLALLLLPILTCAKGANPESYTSASSFRFTGIIIPGFASSRLRAWAILRCPFSPFQFNPLDPVWLDTQKVVAVPSCWLRCMMLDPATQADDPECKSRVDTGLSAITELDPGYITGPLSSVWREWINWSAEFGVDVDAIIAAPYDWRLYPRMLEERDLYFHKLKLVFEGARKLKGGPALVFAHSMGNNVFRYFLSWLKHEIAPKEYQRWLDFHIHSFHAIAAPLLGSPEAVKGLFTGLTFGLPISEGVAKSMGNSFAASLWMYPVPRYTASSCPSPSSSCPVPSSSSTPFCHEGSKNASGWPMDLVSLTLSTNSSSSPSPSPDGALTEAYPSMTPEEALAKTIPLEESTASSEASSSSSSSTTRSYTAEDVADGTMLRDIAHLDIDAKIFSEKLPEWYLNDPILNPLTPWERPPIKNVFCSYGIDLKTEVGYEYKESGAEYPNNWKLEDVFYEVAGGNLRSRSGKPVEGSNKFGASGDVTVPYVSLSFCKTWLGPSVNITRAPMQAHEPHHVQSEKNVPHDPSEDLVPSADTFSRNESQAYITYYEDSATPGLKTAVWELDKVDHRNIVQSHILLREIWLEAIHNGHPNVTSPFVRKEFREPMRDEDCYWDYAHARCALHDSCEYRYTFGDVHLGQSCRLKKTNTNLFHKYL